MRQIRPYGRGRIAVHLSVDHPALDDLKAQALFVATYSERGQITAFDLAVPADQASRLRRKLAQIEQV